MKSDKKNESLSQVRIVLHKSIREKFRTDPKKSQKNEKIKDEKILYRTVISPGILGLDVRNLGLILKSWKILKNL